MECSNRAKFIVVNYCTLLCVALLSSLPIYADTQVFRIGTGGSAGTYFPVGSLIANAIVEEMTIDEAGVARVPELIAIAQRSTGSVANVRDIRAGLLEAALVQADVAFWAYSGTGPFADDDSISDIRLIGSLYRESLHLVARAESGIHSIRDLKGRRVSIDEKGSGTHVDVTPIINSFGVMLDEIHTVHLKTEDAIDRIKRDELDAFFILAGYPIDILSQLTKSGKATIVPITGKEVDVLLNELSFFIHDEIPADVYSNDMPIATLSVSAQLIVPEHLSSELVYKITKLLWSATVEERLTKGHAKGHEIRLPSALTGRGIPLHAGADQFYRELGMLRDKP